MSIACNHSKALELLISQFLQQTKDTENLSLVAAKMLDVGRDSTTPIPTLPFYLEQFFTPTCSISDGKTDMIISIV